MLRAVDAGVALVVAVTPPHGLLELQARFGALVIRRDPLSGDFAIVSPKGWESANMVMLPTEIGYAHKLYVHKAIVEPLTAALGAAMGACPDYAIRTIGCFAPRLKRVNNAVSVHSWGLAVDICADTNPQTKPGEPIIRDIPDAFGEAFEKVGFTWGLRFKHPDPQHFQWVTGY